MKLLINSAGWDPDGIIEEILGEVSVPKMALIEQKLNTDKVIDIDAEVARELRKSRVRLQFREGMSVAITVGSRGIADLSLLVKSIVVHLKKMGVHPFIIPAMGSHGGATAEGQRELIESLGVTEKFVGAPIKATMDTVVIGTTVTGKPVHVDAFAAKADGIIVLGRIKPHPAFRGPYESGLMKMMAIGLGKQRGAQVCHADGFGKMAEYVPEFGSVVVEKANIICGLAVVENGVDEIHTIEALLPEQIAVREPELLELSRSLMARIPFARIDVLIIDRIGKNISGDGMDPNVTGSFATSYQHGGPEVRRYVILDLTEETHGNALGLGMADFSTARVFDKVDLNVMYANSITSTVPGPSRLPLIMKNDSLAIRAGILTANIPERSIPRIVRILDTSHVQRMWITKGLQEEAEKNSQIKLITDFNELRFNKNGDIFDLGKV